MSEIKSQPTKELPKENPLTNIMVNVLIPVLSLSMLSKDKSLEAEPQLWHLGPVWALIIALALPLGYGIWFFIRHRQTNFFSILGLASVLLTGGLTLFLWRADGSVDASAPLLFGLKEASIPFILGVAIFASHWTRTPLFNTFLFNEQMFDIKRIEQEVDNNAAQDRYAKLIFQCTLIFAGSFLISTILNFFLAQYFLSPDKIDYNAANARELYNGAVGRITGWGFVVIALPILGILAFCFFYLLKGLRQITGLENEKIMLPR